MQEQIHFENLSIDERITLKLILKNYNGLLWTVAIWLSDRWQAVVNRVMDIWLSYNTVNF